ncbi:kinase-like domain-containing protein [Rhizophagus diaphanus]|nr:kinase-like domain-containing protein [Rhizophagus diaphanus] [Rhizophagus sp. MUCL 43196]
MFHKWVNEKNIKLFDFNEFLIAQELGDGSLGKAYYANKNSGTRSYMLKYVNINDIIVEDLIKDLETRRKFNAHINVLKFYGVVKFEPGNECCYLVMEYADSGTLRQYLKAKFEGLTWEDKNHLAIQLVSVVSDLHDEEIVHRYLNPNTILVHQNTVKLKFFNKVNKKIKEFQPDLSIFPYTDPKMLQLDESSQLGKKSDVYSVGVLLWEISSGKPPFGDDCSVELVTQIINGVREEVIPNTPTYYSELYTECWDDEPDKRPSMNDVVKRILMGGR